MHIPGDVIFLRLGQNRWIAYNVRIKTSLGLDSQSLCQLDRISNLPDENQDTSLLLSVWDTHWFSQTDGSLNDPSRFIRSPEHWPPPHRLKQAEFTQKLIDLHLVVTNEKEYQSLLDRPHHPLDRKHLGNFHDQLGRHLLFEKRVNPSEWWVKQKFDSNGLIREDTPYGSIQYPGLIEFFNNHIYTGLEILDVGCGNGIYSEAMSNRGANVTGIDPSSLYIESAQSKPNTKVKYLTMNLQNQNGFEGLSDKTFDWVFMSDSLLFSFISISPYQSPSPDQIFAQIYRVLKSGGQFISIEPHGDYYLNPWLGDSNRPWTIHTEHKHRFYSSVPTLENILEVALRNSFVLKTIREFYTYPNTSSDDSRRDCFFSEFPLWHLLSFMKI